MLNLEDCSSAPASMPVHMVMSVCMVRQLLEVINNIIGSISIGATYGLSVFL